MPVSVDKMIADLKRVAKDLGLPFGDRTMTYNSRLAQEMGLWAQSRGKGHEFHLAVFKAYFVDGRNLARKEVLMELVASCGLDPVQGESVLDNRSFSDAVDADWALSRQSGIQAAPTFVYGFQRLVGAQPYLALKNLVIPG